MVNARSQGKERAVLHTWCLSVLSMHESFSHTNTDAYKHVTPVHWHKLRAEFLHIRPICMFMYEKDHIQQSIAHLVCIYVLILPVQIHTHTQHTYENGLGIERGTKGEMKKKEIVVLALNFAANLIELVGCFCCILFCVCSPIWLAGDREIIGIICYS